MTYSVIFFKVVDVPWELESIDVKCFSVALDVHWSVSASSEVQFFWMLWREDNFGKNSCSVANDAPNGGSEEADSLCLCLSRSLPVFSVCYYRTLARRRLSLPPSLPPSHLNITHSHTHARTTSRRSNKVICGFLKTNRFNLKFVEARTS